MTIRLLMQVKRDTDGRLGGQVTPAGSDTMHGFSGTLELLKVLEELVLPDSEVDGPKEVDGLKEAVQAEGDDPSCSQP